VLPILRRDKSGNMLSEHGDILQRCRQYVCDLQTTNARSEELISENATLSNAEEVPPPPSHLSRIKSSNREVQIT